MRNERLAAVGEIQRDRLGDVVGESSKCRYAIDGARSQGSLQGRCARPAAGRDDGVIVAGAQVAELIFDSDGRLRGKRQTRRGTARRLGEHGQARGGGSANRDGGRSSIRQRAAAVDYCLAPGGLATRAARNASGSRRSSAL